MGIASLHPSYAGYRYRETVYHITVNQTDPIDGETTLTVDGNKQHDQVISLVDDRQEHSVEVKIRGSAAQPSTPSPRKLALLK